MKATLSALAFTGGNVELAAGRTLEQFFVGLKEEFKLRYSQRAHLSPFFGESWRVEYFLLTIEEASPSSFENRHVLFQLLNQHEVHFPIPVEVDNLFMQKGYAAMPSELKAMVAMEYITENGNMPVSGSLLGISSHNGKPVLQGFMSVERGDRLLVVRRYHIS